jgi:hypothetical protein
MNLHKPFHTKDDTQKFPKRNFSTSSTRKIKTVKT